MADKKKVQVPGELEVITIDGKLAPTRQIYDETYDKFQQELNREMKSITDQMQIAIDGGSVQLTGDPDDIVEGSGKVPNANAIAGKISDEVADAVAAEETRAKTAEKQNADDIDAIEEKIPSQASSSNKLADRQYVDDKVATDTATYRGYYNLVTDLGLTTEATEEQIATALAAKMASVIPPIVPDNNDYAYVMIPTADATPTLIARIERYKYNGTAWLLEYPLNNSGFTADQWASINSGITSGLVGKLGDLPTAVELAAALLTKQDVIDDLQEIRSGAAAGSTAYQKPGTGIPLTDMSQNVQNSTGAYDISAANAVGGVLATYADLSAALAAIDPEVKRPGMEIKFVQSSDNKYVQWRLMADEWSTNSKDWAIADEGVYVENPEFVYVKTDAEGKILWAIKVDGSIYYGAGVPQQVVDYIQQKIEELSLDEYEDIVAFLNGIEEGESTLQQLLNTKANKNNAELTDKISLDKEVDAETEEVSETSVQHIDNPEFVSVWLDKDKKILFGVQSDGNFLFGCGVPQQIVNYIESRITELSLNEYEDIVTFLNGLEEGDKTLQELLNEKADKEEGKSLIDAGFAESKSTIDDPENRLEIKTDNDKKIISFRNKEGVLHENVGIKTNSLLLTDQGMTDFQKALKDAGFQGGGMDFSGTEVVELPEPKNYAILNLLIDSLPVNDSDLSEGYAEYYDFAGNYWKKSIELAAQGQTSRIFARSGGKGNYTLDIADGSEIKFGSWIPQDSFHLKGCAKDVVRGILPTSYKFAWEIMNYLNAKPNRVLIDEDGITETAATGERINDWPTDARCLPDGFPCEVYINGEYWGLYSWQLKKHRKNYSMDKKDYTSFFLDADKMMSDNYTHGIWNDGPDAYDPDNAYDWKWWNGFDIKGPKDLICMDGSEFDGDNPKELIDSTSQYYDSSNKKHKGSATTKALIRSFQTRYNEIKTLIDNSDIAEAKELFNTYFDVNACLLVYIYNCLMRNADSIKKNTLWGMYGSGKIFPALWDLDGMYGEGWVGDTAVAPSAALWDGAYATSEWPLALFWTLYETEIKAAYAELRRNKVIDISAWKNIVFGWCDRIGKEAYERDIEKWPETPSYRINYTNTEYWTEMGWLSSKGSYEEWDENTSYAQGDSVLIKAHSLSYWYKRYVAKKASTGVCPVTKFYEEFPVVGGFFDSPKRWKKWMEGQIVLCDIVMEYSE